MRNGMDRKQRLPIFYLDDHNSGGGREVASVVIKKDGSEFMEYLQSAMREGRKLSTKWNTNGHKWNCEL